MIGINFGINVERAARVTLLFNIGRAILGRNFDVTIERTACEGGSAMWNLGTN
jgi:hypothetical protein